MKGQGLNAIVDIVIALPDGVSFSATIREGEDLTDWFDNLPPGLTALAHNVKKGAARILIYISGIPETTREVLKNATERFSVLHYYRFFTVFRRKTRKKEGHAEKRQVFQRVPRRSEVQISVPARFLSSNQDMHFGSPAEAASIDAWNAQESVPSGAAN